MTRLAEREAFPRQRIFAGDAAPAVAARIERWSEEHVARRLWARDHTLWSADVVPELADRLGWLTPFETVSGQIDELTAFARSVREEGTRHVVLLGMGGSSLAPEVYQATFGNADGHPALIVLDSTHPAAVAAVASRIDARRTLFLVSSKSGTTLESLSFFRAFWGAVGGGADAGRHFVAITDPGTPLEGLARERGFRRVFWGPPDVGGRYSALTAFGIVPAALIGVDVAAFVERGRRFAASSMSVPEPENQGLALGAALGELARAGRDKLTIFTSAALAAFPAWLEQLIAESTGKDGKGIVPIADEPLSPPDRYWTDRVFVSLTLDGEDDFGAAFDELESKGFPTIRIRVEDRLDLAAEIFRWEVATAASGIVLGVQPFDQPDVQLAKDLARAAMSEVRAASGADAGEGIVAVQDEGRMLEALGSWLSSIRPGDYAALQAYLAPAPEVWTAMQTIRTALVDRFHVATTAGYGPRFLHSTGQLHKGGPNTGVFLQILDDPADDMPVPETAYTFGAVIRAQAAGDYGAMMQRQRRALRVQVGRHAKAGMAELARLVQRTLSA